MKFGGMLDYHIGMCILSGIYIWTKIVDMTAVVLSVFQQILVDALLLNDLQDCYETLWHVKLPYWNVHIVRNLCLGKNCTNEIC